MNRFFRRHKQEAENEQGLAAKQKDVFAANTPQDVTSTRAKSQRHGKVTADKWNQ